MYIYMYQLKLVHQFLNPFMLFNASITSYYELICSQLIQSCFKKLQNA